MKKITRILLEQMGQKACFFMMLGLVSAAPTVVRAQQNGTWTTTTPSGTVGAKESEVRPERRGADRWINLQVEAGTAITSPLFSALATNALSEGETLTSGPKSSALILHGLGIIPQFKLSHRVALSLPTHLSLYSITERQGSAWENATIYWWTVGPSLEFALSGDGVMASGWFLSPALEASLIKPTVSASQGSSLSPRNNLDAFLLLPSVSIGYKWQLDSGFNIGLRAGVGAFVPISGGGAFMSQLGAVTGSSGQTGTSSSIAAVEGSGSSTSTSSRASIGVLPMFSLTMGYAF